MRKLTLIALTFMPCIGYSAEVLEGRFRLFQGEYTVTTETTTIPIKALFKLDTQTGELFECTGYQLTRPDGVQVQGSKCSPFNKEFVIKAAPRAN